MNDINLNYYGGSGGFMALWVLLASTDYRCKFNYKTQDLSIIKNNHWKIKKINEWKFTEIWPDNEQTTKSNIKNKLFYYCNTTEDQWNQQLSSNSKIVFVYTDIETQLLLCKQKRAAAFFDPAVRALNWANENFINSYNNIKDPLWPNIKDIHEFDLLDNDIQLELKNVLGINNIGDFIIKFYPDKNITELSEEFKNQRAKDNRSNCFTYNDHKIIPNLKNKIYECDHAVFLQDIIKTHGNALLNPLGYETNDEVRSFIKFWLNLHPTDTQKILTS